MPDVVQFELVSGGGILDRCAEQLPWRANRYCAQHPSVVVQSLDAEHLKVLGAVWRRSVGIGLVKSVGHADALDGLLCNAVNHHRHGNAGGLQDRRHDVDHMMELPSNTTVVGDPCWP